MATTRSLTPAQDLMLDALLGRRRAGHRVWTFERRHTGTARELEAKSLVNWKHGTAPDTIVVWLTDAAVAEYMDPDLSVPLAAPGHVLRAAAHLYDTQAPGTKAVDTATFLRDLAQRPELLGRALTETA